MRMRRGWTQAELARRTGLGKRSLQKLEGSDPQQLRLNTFVALVIAFDLSSLDQLVGAGPGPTSALVEEHWKRAGGPRAGPGQTPQ